MTAIGKQLRNRRAAAQRLPVLGCGRSDPWHYEPMTAGYAAAARHLMEQGLTPAPDVPALQELWQHGGEDQRLAVTIAERWQASA